MNRAAARTFAVAAAVAAAIAAGCIGWSDPQYWRDTHSGKEVYDTYCLGCHGHKWYRNLADFEIRSWVDRDPHWRCRKPVGFASRDKDRIYEYLIELKRAEEKAALKSTEERYVPIPGGAKPPAPWAPGSVYYPGPPYERLEPEANDPHPERPMEASAPAPAP